MQLGGRSSSTSSTEAAKAAAALHLHNKLLKLELLLNHSQAVYLLTLFSHNYHICTKPNKRGAEIVTHWLLSSDS